MQANLRSLFGKLNPATRAAMEAAAGLCVARTNFDVEVEHLLIKLIDTVDTDCALILRHAELDNSRLVTQLNRSVDRFKRGNGRTPAFSPDLLDLMTHAWTIASLDFQADQIRTGYIIMALLADDKLARTVFELVPDFRKLSLEDLRRNFDSIVQSSRENVLRSEEHTSEL